MDSALRGKMVAFIRTELARGHSGLDVEKDSLIDTGVIDSVGIMKLVEFLSKELKIHVSDDDVVPENFENIDAIERLIDAKSKR